MMGSVNYITTIINLRAPGMTMFRMPMTIWAMLITAILQAFALPVLTVALFHAIAGQDGRHHVFLAAERADVRQLAYGDRAVDSRSCGSICSGFIRIRPCTS